MVQLPVTVRDFSSLEIT